MQPRLRRVREPGARKVTKRERESWQHYSEPSVYRIFKPRVLFPYCQTCPRGSSPSPLRSSPLDCTTESRSPFPPNSLATPAGRSPFPFCSCCPPLAVAIAAAAAAAVAAAVASLVPFAAF